MSFLHWISVGLLLLTVGICSAQEQQQQSSPFPVRVNTTVIRGSNGCPTQQVLDAHLDLIRNEVQDSLDDIVTPYLDGEPQPPCPCGGPGNWTKIAHLDMTDPNQQCPSNWTLNEPSGNDIRGCGRTRNNACDSNFYPSNGRTYSRVCGKIIAYQRGTTNAFLFGRGLESIYVDGLSLTHGAAGSREHIWTFVAATYETHSDSNTRFKCACTDSNYPWPHTVPSFIGDDYFCDTGDHDDGFSSGRYYPDDPLFDGQGCGPNDTCCQLNTPPWFCTQLMEPTSDDLEIRNCGDQSVVNEDVVVSMIDINVQ